MELWPEVRGWSTGGSPMEPWRELSGALEGVFSRTLDSRHTYVAVQENGVRLNRTSESCLVGTSIRKSRLAAGPNGAILEGDSATHRHVRFQKKPKKCLGEKIHRPFAVHFGSIKAKEDNPSQVTSRQVESRSSEVPDVATPPQHGASPRCTIRRVRRLWLPPCLLPDAASSAPSSAPRHPGSS